ncbi:uncharacterized protein KY384_000686 [Bacidia gigantensis]|uniref:uncharacterized protein n=1 Tax=Bacidia gigantensis TaxID=2732470 RepID=UPI001D03FBEF|nr:uncharacterized protein KY384_000686 [Bacidia gigantensis]KAG8525924.1 hypothetical protein KY384_000686 [Bacidia gigantensis]
MNFNPPQSTTQNANISSPNQTSGARLVRTQPSAWGQPAPGASTRRGLTPLSTGLESSATEPGRGKNTSSPSPFTSTFSSVVNSSTHKNGSRSSHSSSFSTSPFPSIQAGSQQGQPTHSLLSPRSRAITPASNPQSASSAAASTPASQVGGGASSGGGGGYARSQTFSPPLSQYSLTSPTATTFERSSYSGPAPSSANSGQSSVSKIVATQIFLLLGSITEKEGKAKWETQAEAIRRLVEANGMENFPKYFRRLLSGNSPQIFPGISRNVENPANYPILVREVDKIIQDPEQGTRIAEAIDGAEGELFRDFDLDIFIRHFKLHTYAKVILLSAFTRVTKQELKTKAAILLNNTADDLAKALANADNDDPDVDPVLLATCALRFLHDSPQGSITQHDYNKVKYCVDHRYSKLEVQAPMAIQALVFVMELDQTEQGLYLEVRKAGPDFTKSLETSKKFLAEHVDWNLDERQVSSVLLYMVLSPDWLPHDPANFAAAVRATSVHLDWQEIIRGFDRANLPFSEASFLSLYNLLLPIAKNDTQLDLQALWRGPYESQYTHFAILSALYRCSPAEIDASLIPNLRAAYDPTSSLDGPEGVEAVAEVAKRDITISMDAITAPLDLCFPDSVEPDDQQLLNLEEIIGEKIGLWSCSASAIEPPTVLCQQLIRRFLQTYLLKRDRPEHSYVLHTVWKHDKKSVAGALLEAHIADPLELTTMLDISVDLGWLDELLTMTTSFGFDLAALAHRNGLIPFREWAERKMATSDKIPFINALSKFGIIKAQDELRISRDEQLEPRTVSLGMHTAYDMLDILHENMQDAVAFKSIQRTFLQAYPRLILLCEGIVDGLDVDCKQSNAMPRTADAEMQELYKRMYGKELDVTEVIRYLQECKASNDSAKRDLFACMIHGLFDEYSCFSEYPLDPLSKTALLFGGIIEVGLISDLTLRVAREMVLDALGDYPKDASMFKFGLQALQTFRSRLQEPDWVDYCKSLAHVPGLFGTLVYTMAVDALAQNGVQLENGEINGADGIVNSSGLANTDEEEDGHVAAFPFLKSINSGPAPGFSEPDEEIKDKVVFFFNNVSQQNLDSKFEQLKRVLRDDHYGWFADFLVNERAKVEPNYQPLYLEVLYLLDSSGLWNQVLHATYLIIQHLMNADTTIQSASERKNLKSLAIWLGSLTLAQDKPVKRKNIAFLDLLVEGYQYEKLLLVIPFVCNFLAQGKHSTIFKPPNPWVLEILAALVEFYHQVNITTNQKFDIEVLCDELGVDIKVVEPSKILMERPYDIIDQTNYMLPDGIRTFENLPLGGINGSVQNPKFEVEAMHLDLPDLEQLLKFPPPSGSTANQTRLRQVVVDAVTHAIYEIIGSVIERSVTIATIATSNLISKDFACEEDEDRLRHACHQMAKQLSQNLALVTCKDPLKQSMSNYIRRTQVDSPEQAFPEGTILMCVNDNLDIACEIVENKAADQAIPEIEEHVQRELAARIQWRSEHPNEPYIGPAHNRWSTQIAEPYKQTPNGLNPEQMAIYSEFGRQPRGPPNHAQSSSADSGRQVPDILQDTFSSMSHLSAATENMSIPNHVMQHQQYQPQRGRMLPPPLPASVMQVQSNGYLDPAMVEGRVNDLLREIDSIMKENEGRSVDDIRRETSLFELLEQVKEFCLAYDKVALMCAEKLCRDLYGEIALGRTAAQIYVYLLATLYHTSPEIAKEVAQWAYYQNDANLLATDVTIELLKSEIMQFDRVDESLALLINRKEDAAVDALSRIINEVLLDSRPVALRADFAKSFTAIAEWYLVDKSMDAKTDIWRKINSIGSDEDVDGVLDGAELVKQNLAHYVFLEWIRLCENNPGAASDKVLTAFVLQGHVRQLTQNPEVLIVFLRFCIDEVIEAFDKAQSPRPQPITFNDVFTKVDSLARFAVILVKSQGDLNGSAKTNKYAVMDTTLSLITLIMNHHQVTRGEHATQRIFFRLLSSILCYWQEFFPENSVQSDRMLLVFAEHFLRMGPRHFPGFIHHWLALISHRFFMPSLLKLTDGQVSSPNGSDSTKFLAKSGQGYDAFAKIMELASSYISHLMQPEKFGSMYLDLYRGFLRVLLILHHDFPEFLAETHFRLCNALPSHATQLLNIVLSAYPSSFPELPNPFVVGLKIDRLEEVRRSPRIIANLSPPQITDRLQFNLDAAIRNINSEHVARVKDAFLTDTSVETKVDAKLIHWAVLYIAQTAITAASQRGGSNFISDSPQITLLQKLCRDLRPDARYQLLCSMVNQLRWPNAHTHYFAYALLHLFGTEFANHDAFETREQIVTILLERLHAVLPHPWGLLVVMLELLKNPAYNFWHLPMVKDSPQVQADTALVPIRPFLSKSAQKAYLSIGLLAATSTLLLGVASIAFWLFYYAYVPQPGVERVVHLQFGDGHPFGLTKFPSALVSNQAYDISLHFHLPRSPTNLRAGNFMLSLSLLPSPTASSNSALLPMLDNQNKTIAYSRRPATLTYVSQITSTASTLSFLPLYVFGFSKESESLRVPMFEAVEFPKGVGNVPQAASVSLEADEKMQIYSVEVVIIARLSGLRWILYNHRILSFLVFASGFWMASMFSMSVAWLGLSLYMDAETSGGGAREKKSIKNEEETTPESETFKALDESSETHRTFPTLGRQKPLRYPPSDGPISAVGIKREEDEAALKTVGKPLQVTAAGADDEDDFEDAAAEQRVERFGHWDWVGRG